MAISERERRNLYEQAERSMGKEAADTLMASLPPVGWADVATKSDLDAARQILEARIDGGLDGLRTDFDKEMSSMHAALNRQTKWLYGTFAAAAIAVIQRLA